MMSQIVMSTFRGPSPVGLGNASSFFDTFVPRVWMYLSSKSSRTKRRISEVLPTAASPTRHIFIFIRRTSMGLPFGVVRSLELVDIKAPHTLLSGKTFKDFDAEQG